MKQATPRRLVLFQEITVRWHKASRGAPGAIARNRVHEVIALPANPPNTPWPCRLQQWAPQVLPPLDQADDRAADIFLHRVVFGEDNHFQSPRAEYWIALRSRLPEPTTLHLPRWNVPPLTLMSAHDKLQVQFEWSSDVFGAPQRDYRPSHERVTLAIGRWMQVRYNGRHIYREDGAWYYEKHVLNIGLADALVPSLFVAASPDYQITDFADLY
jgi:hypothetical protein